MTGERQGIGLYLNFKVEEKELHTRRRRRQVAIERKAF